MGACPFDKERVMQAKSSISAAVCVIALAFAQTIATTAHSEQIATSCADCPSYRGEFSLENKTGVAIKYQIKWGNSQWKSFTVPDGKLMSHWHPLDGNDKAPSPLLRFDRFADGASVTNHVVDMDFYKVGSGGYGTSSRKSAEKKYVFKFAADNKTLLVTAKN
jgi:hypothetical protein